MNANQTMVEKILADIAAGWTPAEMMKRDERLAGRLIIEVDSVAWLPSSEWIDPVVSTDGRQVHIIAILAREPGRGAFTRLVVAIMRAGLCPVVVEPMFSMPAILQRWSWSGEYRDGQEQWRPHALSSGSMNIEASRQRRSGSMNLEGRNHG